MISTLLCLALTAYWLILIVHVVFSWVPRPPDPIMPLVRGVRALVEPVAAPIRRAIPPARIGSVGLDLSIIVLFVLIFILQALIC